ncbi:squamous cell carcinoma antigen recognized by T-cells 3-like [Diaphorina citri]|uniref:Squamous cell carcinoma antigen recognized by T-cells 3-like n=1 Tax=Diaphorina citri TaxID=121845 RepID=A0A3Q0ILL2_DIACI|nr:squamous cell carcinoma antigen recognized by T-cells 3-like [Diaphorina citri]
MDLLRSPVFVTKGTEIIFSLLSIAFIVASLEPSAYIFYSEVVYASFYGYLLLNLVVLLGFLMQEPVSQKLVIDEAVDIWQEYGQFSIGCMESHGVDWVRNVLERGLSHGGIHAASGVILWETYREFENCMLASLQASNPDPSSEPVLEQQKRVGSLFKRQLSCPLMDMERTFAEFHAWLSGVNNEGGRVVDVKAVEFGYKGALAKLAKILTFEETLMCTESNSRLPTYESYLSYEKNPKEGGNNPTRVQTLYERALADLPLTDALWISYIKYMSSTIQLEEPVLKVIERALRNCPWISKLWVFYLQALERFGKPMLEITGVLEKALSAGLAHSHDFLAVWNAYISYLRRLYDATVTRDKDSEEVTTLVDKFRTIVEQAYSHVVGQFGIEADPHIDLLHFWAYFEASRSRNLEKMRLVWNDILRDYGTDKAAIWCQYIAMERQFGDHKHLRKLYQRALSCKTDWPESIATDWLTFEKQEGSLDSYEFACGRVEEKMKQVEKEREEEAKKTAGGGGGGGGNKAKKKKGKEKAEESNKRKISTNGSPPPTKQSKFAHAVTTTVIRKPKPLPPTPTSSDEQPMDTTSDTTPKKTEEELLKERGVIAQHDPSKDDRTVFLSNMEDFGTDIVSPFPEEELLKERGVIAQHDPSKDDRTVFLSNMDFAIGEEVIRETLASAGTIEEVRLVKNFKGLSKGYAFVVFSKQSEAQAALGMDRIKINKRPLFISECNPEKASRKPGLKFNVGVLEKNKLFVKNLPFTTTEQDLRQLFGEYGELADVRLVVHRSGKSKGLAYVEYKDEASASRALLKTDNMLVGDKNISVALSKPPERKVDASGLSSDFSRTISLGGGVILSKNGGWRHGCDLL